MEDVPVFMKLCLWGRVKRTWCNDGAGWKGISLFTPATPNSLGMLIIDLPAGYTHHMARARIAWMQNQHAYIKGDTDI